MRLQQCNTWEVANAVDRRVVLYNTECHTRDYLPGNVCAMLRIRPEEPMRGLVHWLSGTGGSRAIN